MLLHRTQAIVEPGASHCFEFCRGYVAAQIIHFGAFGGIFYEVEGGFARECDVGGAIFEALTLYELNSLFHSFFFLLFIGMRLEFEHHIDVGASLALLEIRFERWQIFTIWENL